ncbi:helix-turn-helix domain-containing protein [Streptococcus hyointestinalis]
MNRLKELRQEKKAKQEDLAEVAGVSAMTISRWENGESTIKSDKAQKLADYFGVQVSYLLGYSDFRTWAEEDFLQTTGYPITMSNEPSNKVVKIEIPKNTLSDDELMALPPEERKEYISEYLDAMNKVLSSLADTISNTVGVASDVTDDQLGKLTNSLIKTLAKLNEVAHKD